MTQHTPGPPQVAVKYDAYHPRPGITVTYGNDRTKEQAEEIAALLRTAPALLAALEESERLLTLFVMGAAPHGSVLLAARKQNSTAIRQARGKE